jgi:hypothetical protein
MSQEMYSTNELAKMNEEELRAAQANGFVKPDPDLGPNFTPQWEPEPDTADVLSTPEYLPRPAAPQDPYAVTAWGETEYDFRVPSGQLCRMKKLRPEELVEAGLLDRLTRLPAFAEAEVRKAEGQPPLPTMPSKEDLATVVEVLDQLIPMVVVKPYVAQAPKDGEGRTPGVVYVDMIELTDRIAIMNRAVQGVSKMDNFRQEP